MQDLKRHSFQFCIFFGLFMTLTPTAYGVQPVPFGQITSTPGWRKDPFGSGRLVHHNGYDIAVPIGTPVTPAQAGSVSYAGKYKGYGYLVAVDHGNGYVTLYGHLSRILVNVGMPVNTETVLALSGNTGHSTGPHLHYEIRQWPGARAEQSPPEMEKSTPPQIELVGRRESLETSTWYHEVE